MDAVFSSRMLLCCSKALARKNLRHKLVFTSHLCLKRPHLGFTYFPVGDDSFVFRAHFKQPLCLVSVTWLPAGKSAKAKVVLLVIRAQHKRPMEERKKKERKKKEKWTVESEKGEIFSVGVIISPS
ncbi:hypothetical protein CEXT_377511 [Caerostris extrusa]|uniref:Uncharacterized protein n=1 Tax=Caerostris extrusa TaxID=172846 RepID=A0AAV4WJ27_CAEEX|nr:hypothetical protein CEXT_377511 [Caerostris extrusa]